MAATPLSALAAEPDPTDRLADAGAMVTTTAKAAAWAELPAETAAALTVAAQVVDRYAHGYLPPDDALDDLAATLAAFVVAMRQRARDARRAA